MQPNPPPGILVADAAPLAAPDGVAAPRDLRVGGRWGLRKPLVLGHVVAVGRGITKDVLPSMSLARSLAMYDTPDLRPDLGQHLRRATATSHEQLEHTLDLLGRLGDRQGFLHVLERFWGFHVVWEAAIRRRTEIRAFHEPRSRLPHLRRDLALLGRTSAEIDALPRCEAATSLAADAAHAVGSIYVMEGSTLGGQVIGRALAGVDWVPTGGLSYFHPYGDRTGQMWRDYRQWAQDHPAAADPKAVAAGANATFDLLRGWLA